MTNKAMYLDDIRNPTTDKNWVVVRSTAEAVEFVFNNHKMTKFASFDHDLGGEDTAILFIKWLIDYDLDNDGTIIDLDFSWNVHSANPVGSNNINGLLKNYMNFKRKNQNG